MTVFRSGIGNQLRAFERRVDDFVKQSLINGGNEIKTRMLHEQLSKPQEATGKHFGIKRRSGMAQRSLYAQARKAGNGWDLFAAIGYGGRASYVEEHENRGRIQFRRLAQEVFAAVLDGIRTGLQFLNQGFGQAPVSTSGVQAAPASSPASFGLRQVGERINLQRGIRRERRRGTFGWSSMVRGA